MQVNLTIQERLKDLRVERGLTLEQLSEKTGISKSALFCSISNLLDIREMAHFFVKLFL